MNISIRHLINILNHEGISLREKQEYLKKYQVNTKRRLSIHHRSEVLVEKLAEMIQKRLTNDLYIFYEHDEDRLHLDDQEP
jgi:DNA-binding transcriptional MerR regulator